MEFHQLLAPMMDFSAPMGALEIVDCYSFVRRTCGLNYELGRKMIAYLVNGYSMIIIVLYDFVKRIEKAPS